MVSHCANPECGNEFLYLHDGEVFVIKSDALSQVRYYWLCSSCADHLFVSYEARRGVIIMQRSARAAIDTTAGGSKKSPPAKNDSRGRRRQLLPKPSMS